MGHAAAPSNSANYGANKERGGNRVGGRKGRIIKGRLGPPIPWKGGAPPALFFPFPGYNRLAREKEQKDRKRWWPPTATPSCHLERPKGEVEVAAARRRRRLIPNNSRAHLHENRPSKCSYFAAHRRNGSGSGWWWFARGAPCRCCKSSRQNSRCSIKFAAIPLSLSLFEGLKQEPLSLLTLFAPSRFGTLGRGQMEESHFCVVVNGNFCVFGSWLLTWRLIIAFGLIQGESKILETFFVRGNLLDFEKIEFDVVPCTFVLLAFN